MVAMPRAPERKAASSPVRFASSREREDARVSEGATHGPGCAHLRRCPRRAAPRRRIRPPAWRARRPRSRAAPSRGSVRGLPVYRRTASSRHVICPRRRWGRPSMRRRRQARTPWRRSCGRSRPHSRRTRWGPGIIGRPRAWGERVVGSIGHGDHTKSLRISRRVRARWAKACSPAAESGALVMMVMR